MKKKSRFWPYLVDRLAISLGNKHLGGWTGVDTIVVLVWESVGVGGVELFKIQDRGDLWACGARNSNLVVGLEISGAAQPPVKSWHGWGCQVCGWWIRF